MLFYVYIYIIIDKSAIIIKIIFKQHKLPSMLEILTSLFACSSANIMCW